MVLIIALVSRQGQAIGSKDLNYIRDLYTIPQCFTLHFVNDNA